MQLLLAESCTSTCGGSCLQGRYPGGRENFQKLILFCLALWLVDLKEIPRNAHRLKWKGGPKWVTFMPAKEKQENNRCQLSKLQTPFCHPLKYTSSCYMYRHLGNPEKETMQELNEHSRNPPPAEAGNKSWSQGDQSLVPPLLLMHCLTL